ncbi:MAG: ABC transporter permease [Bryobacteraceae bacterium]
MTALLAAFLRTWRRLSFGARRARFDRELAEEMEFHRSMKQAEVRQPGLTLEASRELSFREMGNITLSSEECRDLWSFVRLERLFQDVRYAARMFRRTPAFTAVAVLSLALGIGGNAAMFSLVNRLLIRPLPYFQPERLVRITGVYPHAQIRYFQTESRTVQVAAAGTPSEYNLTGEGEPLRVVGCATSANLFSVLGVAAARGRTFETGEDLPGGDVAVMSDSLWRTRFAGDPQLVGRVVALNGVHRRIVGIMPAGFSYPTSAVQLWVPMRLDPSNFLEYWGGGYVPLIGRLNPGVTPSVAREEIRSIVSQFTKMFPYPMPHDYNRSAAPIPLQQDLVGDVRGRLMILLCSVGVILLIACANVASLLLSRATTRRKEIALRLALGAGRMRIVRQLLTESVLLALAGAGVGLFLAMAALSVFRSVLPPSIPGLAQASIDWPIAGAAAILAVCTGLVFGLAPALSASQVDLAGCIRTGSQRSTGALWTRLRTCLIGAEVALTVVLVVSAGLLIKSLYSLADVNPGFHPDRVLTVRISPNQSACELRAACVALYDRVLARALEVRGVTDAALVDALPLDSAQPMLAVDVEDHPKTAESPAPLFWSGSVTPGYLRMMRIPLLAGRNLSEADGLKSARVILISAATARHFWPGENPIGKHIKGTGERAWRTVVGVVGDVRQFTLGKNFPDFIPGAMYMPYAQSVREDGQIPAAMTLLVAARSDASRLARDIRSLAQEQDPNVPVGQVEKLEDLVAGSIADFRATIQVFVSFAAAAILLAAIGVYGLVSYWVTQRIFEIGVRVAIGATRGRIVSMIFGQGLRVALWGIGAGVLGALAATRFLTSLLFGVTATDPFIFAVVTGFVLAVASAATAVPAWRASRIDPTRSLRVD